LLARGAASGLSYREYLERFEKTAIKPGAD